MLCFLSQQLCEKTKTNSMYRSLSLFMLTSLPALWLLMGAIFFFQMLSITFLAQCVFPCAFRFSFCLLIGVVNNKKNKQLYPLFQSGLPAMNVEILSQFPSPPVPNLPALAMAMASVMPQHQHQQPMMAAPPVSMAMPTQAPPVMAMAPAAPAQPPANSNFIASFPPAQVTVPSVLHSPLCDHNFHLTNQHVLNPGD